MHTLLRFATYGTFVPDLRTVLYWETVPDSLRKTISQRFFGLNDLIEGRVEDRAKPSAATLLRDMYHHVGLNRDLINLANELYESDVGIERIPMVAEIQSSPLNETFRELLADLPPFVSMPSEITGGSSETQDAIWITRSFSQAEQLLRQRLQTILYESATRLRRELILRGILSTTTQREA